ncbi:response regulator, partial [Candidatus Falkowbacteria bacterium]|nr:response regulator [Candidatus Falkowbacteria bacterium]
MVSDDRSTGLAMVETPQLTAARRILVVDDSRMQRRILAAQLARAGYQVQEAGTAEEALAICAETEPDLILSDWVMPGMSGLEFCRAFREMPRTGYGYFVLLSSKTEKDEVALGLQSGADDYLLKPVNGDELRARLAAGERILRMERELKEKNRLVSSTLAELQGLYDTLDRDLKEAWKLQQSLVRERFRSFGSADVSLLLRPTGHVGGDLVGFFPINARRIGLYG